MLQRKLLCRNAYSLNTPQEATPVKRTLKICYDDDSDDDEEAAIPRPVDSSLLMEWILERYSAWSLKRPKRRDNVWTFYDLPEDASAFFEKENWPDRVSGLTGTLAVEQDTRTFPDWSLKGPPNQEHRNSFHARSATPSEKQPLEAAPPTRSRGLGPPRMAACYEELLNWAYWELPPPFKPAWAFLISTDGTQVRLVAASFARHCLRENQGNGAENSTGTRRRALPAGRIGCAALHLPAKSLKHYKSARAMFYCGNPGKMLPEVVQKVTMTREGDDKPVHINGARLVIGFDKLFLRPAEEERGEGDVVIDNNDLTLIADLTWMGFNTVN
ncbi:hypothetical protein CFD26_102947 [Aspergillus turcosus]|uniref:Uncharacterized protein n=1 Tax=Aspergillus turcosus TaxID=1245748 RepID=A0A421CW21_9EURO|nr:hypothetical protein CFD26_102947 [Aspergillus turcosus]